MGNSLANCINKEDEQIEWARESAFLKGASQRRRTQRLLVGNLHSMSLMLLAREATAQSQEGTIILDVVG